MISEKRKEIERIYLGLTSSYIKSDISYDSFIENVKNHTEAFCDYLYEMLKESASSDFKEPSFSFTLKKYRNEDLIRKYEVPIPNSIEEGYFILKNIYLFETELKEKINSNLVNLLKKVGVKIEEIEDTHKYSFLIDIDQVFDYCDKNNFNLEIIEMNCDFDSPIKCGSCQVKINVPIFDREQVVQRKRK